MKPSERIEQIVGGRNLANRDESLQGAYIVAILQHLDEQAEQKCDCDVYSICVKHSKYWSL